MMKKGGLRHIHVEPMTDGSASVKVHSNSMGMPSDNDGDESASGATPEEAGAHVTRMLKKHFGKSAKSDHPAAKAFGR